MPAGRTKFTLAPDGRLVSKATGQAAPGSYFAVGNTVYKPANNSVGRVKVGSLSQLKNAPKKTQQKIARAAQRRTTRQWISQHQQAPPSIPEAMPGYVDRRRKNFEDRIRPSIENRTLTGREGIRMRMHYNYAQLLDEKVKAGELTEAEAEQLWQEYADSSEAARDKIWDDLQREEELSDRERYGSPK